MQRKNTGTAETASEREARPRVLGRAARFAPRRGIANLEGERNNGETLVCLRSRAFVPRQVLYLPFIPAVRELQAPPFARSYGPLCCALSDGPVETIARATGNNYSPLCEGAPRFRDICFGVSPLDCSTIAAAEGVFTIVPGGN